MNKIIEFKFTKPAVYRIVVQGSLLGYQSDQLGGMQVSASSKEGRPTVSTLVGMINDPASLSLKVRVYPNPAENLLYIDSEG